MGWLNKVKKGLGIAKDLAPIVGIFVPGVATVSEAVDMIHSDKNRSNDEADALNAAAIDSLQMRVAAIEKQLKINQKG